MQKHIFQSTPLPETATWQYGCRYCMVLPLRSESISTESAEQLQGSLTRQGETKGADQLSWSLLGHDLPVCLLSRSPSSALLPLFGWECFPTKIDINKSGTLILTSLLKDPSGQVVPFCHFLGKGSPLKSRMNFCPWSLGGCSDTFLHVCLL